MSAHIPESLPASPKGWTKKLQMHMNFGGGKGGATYTIFDDQGRETCIGYQYDTRKGGLTGFNLPGEANDAVYKTWGELVARYPAFLKAREVAANG